MKKTIFLFIIFMFLAGGIYFFRLSNHKTLSQEVLSTNEADSKQMKQVAQIAIEPPVKISIPSIGVNADIEYVGLDEKKNMDVPKEEENVAWFELGPKPGQTGSAVIAGHLDNPNGAPAVFWDIKQLKSGDEIKITDKNGNNKTFIVKGVENYPWNDFPLQKVFADTSGKKLNLITCGGTFDRETKNYSQRTVVYAELKPQS